LEGCNAQSPVFGGVDRCSIAEDTRFSLGDHFERFIDAQIRSGRYGSASEVIRASLRLLEEREASVVALHQALVDGEDSGDARAYGVKEIKAKARRRAGSRSLQATPEVIAKEQEEERRTIDQGGHRTRHKRHQSQ